MRVLFVCHRFPFPPSGGAKVRAFHIIRRLNESHRVTVAAPVRSDEEARAGEGLGEHCAKYISGRITEMSALARALSQVPTTTPSSMGYFFAPDLARRIRRELEATRYDLIFVHCSSVAQYVEQVEGIPKVLDFCDMDSQKWLAYSKVKPLPKALAYWLEGHKLGRAERALARRFDLCTCATRAELADLDAYGTGRSTGWFPNGVDLDYYAPAAESYEPNSICFVGRMDYFPNEECMVDFCSNTLPSIREKRPQVKLRIVGADPSPRVRNLQRIPGVTVTGTVPDVRPHVQASAVAVAPLNIARGTQNKILECMAMGVPVVASGIAAGGTDAVAGEHFLVGSTHAEYAEAILRLLDDPAERTRFSRAGRRRMETNHSWDASMSRLESMIESIRPTRPGPASERHDAAREEAYVR